MLLPILIFIGTLALSLFAAWRVKAKVAHYSKVPAQRGFTGAQAAAHILHRAGINDVEIVAREGFLGDHYDPAHRRLVLSRENFHGASIAAIGIAAHEAGHAIQHGRAYAPLHWRMAAVGVTNFASSIVTWLPLIGLATGFLAFPQMLWIIALGWGVIMAFNLITLPVEFDATRRAKLQLADAGIVSPQEADGVSQVLNAAAWTYVAAFLTSLAYMLLYLLPMLRGGGE